MTWFRLARMLGMSVARAREEIDAQEFYWWKQYLSIEPLDIVQENTRHAILCVQLHKIGAGKCYQTPKPEYFVPDFTKRLEPESDTKQMAMLAKAFVARYNQTREGA